MCETLRLCRKNKKAYLGDSLKHVNERTGLPTTLSRDNTELAPEEVLIHSLPRWLSGLCKSQSRRPALGSLAP